jgi:hypothetical protein
MVRHLVNPPNVRSLASGKFRRHGADPNAAFFRGHRSRVNGNKRSEGRRVAKILPGYIGRTYRSAQCPWLRPRRLGRPRASPCGVDQQIKETQRPRVLRNGDSRRRGLASPDRGLVSNGRNPGVYDLFDLCELAMTCRQGPGGRKKQENPSPERGRKWCAIC